MDRVEISHVELRAPAPHPIDQRSIGMLLRCQYRDRRDGRTCSVRSHGSSLMKLTADRPYADPDKAARKLVAIANTTESA
jgi:hypothetical protein